MGMYTHLRLDIEVYPDFVVEIQHYIDKVPRLRSTSYYFYDRGENYIQLDPNKQKCVKRPGSTEVATMSVLHVDISCKNYEKEIESFLEFLNGKVLTGGGLHYEYVGSVRYEEQAVPDLLFFDSTFGTIVRKKVTVNGS